MLFRRERDFWWFVWLSVQLPFYGMPNKLQATRWALWGLKTMVLARYLGIRPGRQR